MFSHLSVCSQGGGGYLWYQVPSGGGYVEGWVLNPRIHGTWNTTGYSRQAGGTHPTEMLSCLFVLSVSQTEPKNEETSQKTIRLSIPGTSTLSYVTFTNELNDPTSDAFKQLRDKFTSQVTLPHCLSSNVTLTKDENDRMSDCLNC